MHLNQEGNITYDILDGKQRLKVIFSLAEQNSFNDEEDKKNFWLYPILIDTIIIEDENIDCIHEIIRRLNYV